MLMKPKRFYLAAGAAVIGVLTFAALGQAEARPNHGGKHQHFRHFQHHFYAQRHIYVVPVVRPRAVRVVAPAAPVKWAKKCGDAPEQA
jgi:hypothetical protein